MSPSLGRKLLTVLYVAAAAVMYYYNNEVVNLGVGIMYKLFLSAVLVLVSVCVFLVTANLNRAGILIKYVLLFCIPEFVAIAVSIPLWIRNGMPMEVVRRGTMEELYNAGIVMAMAGFVYVFGSRSVWRVLAAMFLANFFRIAGLIAEHGLFAYLEELKTLIVTFSSDTGELIQGAEIHELTFALGMFLVFFILDFRTLPGKRWYIVIAAALTLFFYLSGFKRIGVAANAAAVVCGLLLQMFTGTKDRRRGWFLAASFAVIVVCYLYVVSIRHGLVDYLMDHGINMMSRDRFYGLVEEYYRADPGYLGQGVGFISRFFSESDATALHNDILRIFIDLGFWGFFFWMAASLPVRVWFVAKWQGNKGGLLCFAYMIYLIVTAATDNTFYYVYVTGTAALLTMSFRLEEQEERAAARWREKNHEEFCG